jgi:hypothetical protein
MNALIDCTPQCHCELAGEGIEYSWGCAKDEYHHQPLSAKKEKKETFQETVRKSIAKDVLRKERVRLFSKRAREYICAYIVLSQEEGKQNEDDAVNHCAAVPVKIEQLTKDFKMHRCALDFDKGFINMVITATRTARAIDASSSCCTSVNN